MGSDATHGPMDMDMAQVVAGNVKPPALSPCCCFSRARLRHAPKLSNHGAAPQNDPSNPAVLELADQPFVIICGVTWSRLGVTILDGPEDPSTRRQSAMLTSWILSRRDSPAGGSFAPITCSGKIHVAGSSTRKSCKTSGVRESADKPHITYYMVCIEYIYIYIHTQSHACN